MCHREPTIDVERLARGERAHRVDEDTTRSHQRESRLDQLSLEGGEALDRGRINAPARVWPAPQHAEPGAWRIDEHTIEASVRERGHATVHGDDAHTAAESARVGEN